MSTYLGKAITMKGKLTRAAIANQWIERGGFEIDRWTYVSCAARPEQATSANRAPRKATVTWKINGKRVSYSKVLTVAHRADELNQ